MKQLRSLQYALLCIALICCNHTHAQSLSDKEMAQTILSDARLDSIQASGLRLLNGFNAGTSYGEVWIRDFNTFIDGSMQVKSPQEVKEMLLLFFKFQGEDGNIVDGVIDSSKASVGYAYRHSALAPGWAAHKNTVETDQESSLVQAVKKYITVTGDKAILQEMVGGKTVIQRLEAALNYVHTDRWSQKYGLVTGATTIDWGDVQPESGWGVAINDKTKWAIDIYDNAMFAIAIQDFLSVKPADYHCGRDWAVVDGQLKKQVRKYLWQPASQKYIPHIYLDGSPFPADFREDSILYTGGSACAILAGFNTGKEIAAINRQMVEAAAKEPFATIGITVYPPYSGKVFPNMMPYNYQNAGDWGWFGGRMIEALVRSGYAGLAWKEFQPMIRRTIENKGFYEWYNVRTGKAEGSADFRGEAGVYFDAIGALRQWANAHK